VLALDWGVPNFVALDVASIYLGLSVILASHGAPRPDDAVFVKCNELVPDLLRSEVLALLLHVFKVDNIFVQEGNDSDLFVVSEEHDLVSGLAVHDLVVHADEGVADREDGEHQLLGVVECGQVKNSDAIDTGITIPLVVEAVKVPVLDKLDTLDEELGEGFDCFDLLPVAFDIICSRDV